MEDLSPKFGERLQQLLRNADYKSNNQFWLLHLKGKCNRQTFRKWCIGSFSPSPVSRDLFGEIEKLLQVPAGTLTSFIRPSFNEKKTIRKRTVYGARISSISSHNYYVWEPHNEEEFQGLVKFKTATVLPRGTKRSKKAVWTRSEGGDYATANLTKKNLRLFFGYLCLPKDSIDPQFRGWGLSKDQATLGLLSDKDIVESYVNEFKTLRSGGKYNSGHLLFLNTATSLLRPITGYLYQHPEFALKIGLDANVKKWRKRCIDTRNRLLEISEDIQHARDSGSEEFEQGRDPEAPIAEILDLPNPLTAVMGLLTRMLNDVDTYNAGAKKAVFFRDILLIALLIANPLRIRMFSIMRFDRNLIRKPDGSWWICFLRQDFKNRKSIPSDYKVPVVPEVIPLIERYHREFRPFLFGAVESDYVFLKQSIGRGQNPECSDIYRFAQEHLSKRVAERVRDYFPLAPGFYAHAFRHIVATSIIKNNPEMGFFLASKVLHDKLETIEENYEHLKTHEFFQPYNRLLSGYLSDVISINGSGIPTDKNDGGGK